MKSAKIIKILGSKYLYLSLFVVFSLLASVIPYFKIDLLLTQKIQDLSSPFFSRIMWFVSSVGNQPFMLILIVGISVFLYLIKRRTEAVFCSLAAVGSVLSGSLIKILINRPRPSPETVNVAVWLSDKSFPSNHVLVFTVYFGFLFYLLFRKKNQNLFSLLLMILLALLVASIGISRIYLGAHWASDVVGGYLLGTAWLLFLVWLYNSYHGKR